MKISMMSYTMARGPWGKTHDVAELCRFTRELGLEGIDWVTTYGEDPAAVRKVMDDFHLATVCYTFPADLHRPEAERRAKARGDVESGLATARALGGDKVMIVLPGVKGVPREETRKRALEGLAEAVDLGRRAGVTVTIEHYWGADSAFVTTDDMLAAVRAVPGLAITYDNGNAATSGEDPAEAFSALAEHIVHAHFKDWVLADDGQAGLDGRRYKPALVGEGIIDPRPCLEAMARCGYEGYVNFEYEGKVYDPRQATERGVRLLKDMIAEITAH